MQIGPDGCFHLTYCSKIHPGCGWEELFANLKRYAPALKARLAPEAPFGLGLRLSAAEARELLAGDRLAEFQDFLAAYNLYVFTLNGFPYGDLTGPSVKAGIFAPDWREESRVRYTLDLMEILRRLLPAGVEGSISTSPLSYKAWITPGDAAAWAQMTRNLVRVTASLAHIKAAAGQLIHLDLEPEPDGLLSASREVADFFRHWLLQLGAPILAEQLGMSGWEAHHCLLEHIRVCLDTCHLAVEYEDPAAALDTLAEAGVRVGKVQITAGLKVELPAAAGLREAVARDLETFTHSPYLHQVIGQADDGRRVQFPDLAPALPRLTAGWDATAASTTTCPCLWTGTGTWRPPATTPGPFSACLRTGAFPATWRSRPTPGSGCPRTSKPTCWSPSTGSISGCWRKWDSQYDQRGVGAGLYR